ncbi:riboflavin synthase [Propionimicrobium lymphophilum]|uniref:riboflavin synthase n=1 Tax=Propionimicrobium lymphophilum TaxID=33012 RepID=UPI00254DD7B9|nr:riboflavin synthase [Propionimicrobium lymphophilum]MDK7709494.1 riboflavin synthase [Propionimicrobium lymphophilum]MDK7733480.1 riboflavin synthase [Propionimicrobium lymphophilum]
MFTGIVEEIGEVVAANKGAESMRLSVRGPIATSDATLGCSIAVDGVCLTAVELDGDVFTADVMAETLRMTMLGDLQTGDKVNLERAMAANARLGGHIVAGHVEALGEIVKRSPGEDWELFEIGADADFLRYLVPKGSVTVMGVSLTVVNVLESSFTISLIPATLSDTILGSSPVGTKVNLEADMIGKYIVTYLERMNEGK